jgi:hypothetical protein
MSLRPLLTVAAVGALAFANAATLRAHWSLDNMGTSRRYWEDVTVAVSLYQTREWKSPRKLSINEAVANRINGRLRELLPRAAARAGVRPWEFWRLVEIREFANISPFELRFSDDAGRARLSGFAFILLGGIAPYLPLWLPFLAFLVVAGWIAIEFFRVGEGFASVSFLGLLASSAYLLEALTLPYSAAGFHLVSALGIVAVAMFAFGPPPTRWQVWSRVLAASLLFHVATWCRSSSVVFLPLAICLLLLAESRVKAPRGGWGRLGYALALILLMVAPKALGSKSSHEVWLGMWEGLGDFDRERGHEWSDFSARVALDREGYHMERRGPYWTPETEAIFKRLVLADIKENPLWFVKILGHRVVATLTQRRLAPKASDQGTTYEASSDPAEGVTDVYYNFVKTADVFTAFGRTREASLWMFWLFGGVFLARGALSRSLPWRRRLGVVAAFGLGALVMPVALTTASGIETQVFAFTFLLCAAFLISDVRDVIRGARAPTRIASH